MRFNWVHVRLAAIDADEMRDLVEGASGDVRAEARCRGVRRPRRDTRPEVLRSHLRPSKPPLSAPP